jgi:hypothetical protein
MQYINEENKELFFRNSFLYYKKIFKYNTVIS